jgi:hypothetical protein
MDTMMNLARTRKGRMVHRRDCPQIIRYNMFQTHAVPWLWADDKTEAEVATWIVRLNYSTCKHCNPIAWNNFAVVALIEGLIPVCAGEHLVTPEGHSDR